MSEATEQLRAMIQERAAAVQAKDPAPLAARLSDDVITFDVLPPLRGRGSEMVVDRAREWFDSYDGSIGYDVHELEVVVDGDVGFCSYLYHVTGTLTAGDEVDMWVRATAGCRRIDGQWQILHEHESIPWDPESGRGVLDQPPN